jgi:molecular chaperone GrpE (heat shock protein)
MSEKVVLDWMEDADQFQEALEADSSYSSDLLSSMSLTLEEFYHTLHV